MPPDDTFILSKLFVMSDKAPLVADNPAFGEFVKLIAGVVVLPDIKVRAPVIVPPIVGKLPLAFPVRLPMISAVMVPAEKLPVISLATMVDTVFRFVAVVAEFATSPAVVNVANFSLLISALDEISVFIIKLFVKLPFELI